MNVLSQGVHAALWQFMKVNLATVLQYWAECIAKAQEPNPLSSRDGRSLKPVPKCWKLPQTVLARRLQEALPKVHSMQAGLLCSASLGGLIRQAWRS